VFLVGSLPSFLLPVLTSDVWIVGHRLRPRTHDRNQRRHSVFFVLIDSRGWLDGRSLAGLSVVGGPALRLCLRCSLIAWTSVGRSRSAAFWRRVRGGAGAHPGPGPGFGASAAHLVVVSPQVRAICRSGTLFPDRRSTSTQHEHGQEIMASGLSLVFCSSAHLAFLLLPSPFYLYSRSPLR
jgi:hypothetical protein